MYPPMYYSMQRGVYVLKIFLASTPPYVLLNTLGGVDAKKIFSLYTPLRIELYIGGDEAKSHFKFQVNFKCGNEKNK